MIVDLVELRAAAVGGSSQEASIVGRQASRVGEGEGLELLHVANFGIAGFGQKEGRAEACILAPIVGPRSDRVGAAESDAPRPLRGVRVGVAVANIAPKTF